MFEGIGGVLLLAILDYLYIFVVLGGLALLMVIIGKIVQNIEAKKVVKENKFSPTVISATPVEEKEEFDGKLVAIITAAVASYLEKPKNKFKILSIKKYQTSLFAPWAAMGRQELMSSKKYNFKERKEYR